MPSKLFAYGTLRQGAAPAEIAATVDQLRLVGQGVTRGRLFDLGAYPGAVFAGLAAATGTDAGCIDIEGDVYEVPDEGPWNELDDYEGFQPGDPSASLFIRREIEVRMTDAGELFVCWVYEYNGTTEIPIHREAGASVCSIGPATETRQIS